MSRSCNWRRQLVNQLFPIVTMAIALALIIMFMDQEKPRFIVGDNEINYPLVEQTLTAGAAAGLMFIYPFMALLLHCVVKSRIWGVSVCDRRVVLYWWNKTWCGVFVCFIFVLYSEFLKRWVGKLRPNFLAMCMPEFTTPDPVPGNIVTTYTCTDDPTGESTRSFPSGHSLFSILLFCALGNLLEGHRSKDRVHDPTWAPRVMIQAVLTIIVGPAIALTRYTEHYHYPSDVLVGIISGYIAFILLLYVERVFIKEPVVGRGEKVQAESSGGQGEIPEFSQINLGDGVGNGNEGST